MAETVLTQFSCSSISEFGIWKLFIDNLRLFLITSTEYKKSNPEFRYKLFLVKIFNT